MRRIALVVFLVALAVAGYGLWLLATPDYQGGRNVAAALFLVVATVFGLASGAAMVRYRTR
jgi:hypothetical protein